MIDAILISGFLIAIIEILICAIKGFPEFLMSGSQELFILSIFGFVGIFTILVLGIIQFLILPAFTFLSKHRDTIRRYLRHHPLSFITIYLWFFGIIGYLLIRFFLDHFHNNHMIAFTLIFCIACMIIGGFLLLLWSLYSRYSVDAIKDMKKAGIFTGFLLIILFILNFSWLMVVIDVSLITVLLFFVLFLFIFHRQFQKHPIKKQKRLILRRTMAILHFLIIAATIFNFSNHQEIRVALSRSTSIPARLLPMVSELKNKTVPHPTQKKSTEPAQPFRLSQYIESIKQPFDFSQMETPNPQMDEISWNIIILTIDSMRADHLSCYGYPFETSPNIDRIGKNGVIFKRHYAQGADSPNSIRSILSGILNHRFQSSKHAMFHEILQKEEYFTGYVGFAEIFKNEPFRENYKKRVLIPRNYDEIWGQSTSMEQIEHVIDLSREWKDDQFYIYTHLLDPHRAYIENEFSAKFTGSSHPDYDAEIAMTDAAIGRLINALQTMEILDRTLLVITADHGEELGEHGGRDHGKFLYEESIRIPLIINLPGISGRNVSPPVSAIDILPTLLDFLNIEIPQTVEGKSLLSLIYTGDTSSIGPISIVKPTQPDRQFGMIYGPWKLVYNDYFHTFEMYHLQNDPQEKQNIIDTNLELGEQFRRWMMNTYGDTVYIPPIISGSIQLPVLEKIDFEMKTDAVKTKIITGNAVDTTLNEPRDFSFASTGQYGIADFRNHRILLFDMYDEPIRSFGCNGHAIGEFYDPCGIELFDDDTLLVCDTFNQRVQMFEFNGNHIWTCHEDLRFPMDATRVGDAIFVTNHSSGQIFCLDEKGRVKRIFGGFGSESGLFDRPVGIVSDFDRFLYIADSGNRRIQIFNIDGSFINSIEINGWPEHVFNLPYLCLDNEGRIFTTDPPNHRILVLNSETGQQLTVYPKDNAAETMQFNYPMGIDIDTHRQIIGVMDCKNNRLIKIPVHQILR